jgi:predicted Zn-dependent protease
VAAQPTREVRDSLAVYGYQLLQARQTAKAHTVFRGMKVMFPNDVYVAKSLCITSLALGDAEGALTLAEALRPTANDDDVDALDVVRGKALARLGRADEARMVLEGALRHRQERTQGRIAA